MKYITCSKDMSEVPEDICKFNCKECTIFETNKTNVDNANNDKHIGGSSMH